MPDFFRKAVAFLLRLKRAVKNDILSLTEAKALGEKITRCLFCTLRDGFLFYGWVSTSGSPGLQIWVLVRRRMVSSWLRLA